ncbi:hypothetical protein ABE096_03935 [Robertmurraya massiliosenegalensis]|uniref:hypothetical protein n=1 Tax=Bacillaceae TaxID=186817 RepID=UPI0039A4C5FD
MPVCINRSGRAVPVYDYYDVTKQIGTIYNLELFGFAPGWGGDGVFDFIVFRNPSGNVVQGCLNTNEYNYPSSVYTTAYQSRYRYGTVTLGGTTYNTFKMTRTESVYRTDGSRWGSVAAGQYVATNSTANGSSRPDWQLIHYVRSTSGQWVRVTSGTNTNYGFVNIGLDKGSMYNTISMDGLWINN